MDRPGHEARSLFALLTAIGALAALSACKGGEAETLPLRLEISHEIAGQPLKLGTEYALATGEHLSVDRLRYYLSNFRLHAADGHWSAAERSDADARGYFLIDEARPGTRVFDIAGFAPGQYDGIEFVIGVDTARNTQGAQAGALDPANGMFWTWNTGYIFFKLEGHSPESPAKDHLVEYHIGGADLQRVVYLPLGAKPLRIDPRLLGTVHLQADIAQVFQAPADLHLADKPTVMDPASGRVVADNYADVFRVDHLHHEPRR